MSGVSEITTRLHQERRKYRRFNLQCPIHGRFSSGNKISDFDAVSKNVSIGGLLMETASEISPRSQVSFTMTVQGSMVVRPIRLAGEGRAVRLKPVAANACFAVAVACTRPIAQLEDSLSGAAIRNVQG